MKSILYMAVKLIIPSDDHKCRIGTCFCRAADGTQSSQGCKIWCSRLQHEEGTPSKYVDAKVFGYGKFLKEKVGRQRPYQEAEVEYGRQPAVLGAFEVEVILDAKDGGVRQRGFINLPMSGQVLASD